MQIKGLLPETYGDWPGKMAVEIFLYGCNFRCPYCHNPGLVNGSVKLDTIAEEKVFDFLRSEKEDGWKDGVIISGGEPTLHKELPELIKKIIGYGFPVKIDTNGTNPSMLEQLINGKLIEAAAMDVKADFDSYEKATVRKVSVDDIKKSILLICSSDLDYEFRTTCVPGIVDRGSVEKICSYFESITRERKPKKYVLQQFVGKRENDDNFKLLDPSFADVKPYSRQEMRELEAIAKPFFEEVELRLYD